MSPGEATILACAFFLALGVLAPWGTGFGISVSGLQAGLIGFLILLAAFVIAYSVYHKKLHPESNGALWAQVVALSLALLLLILQYYAIHSTTLFGVQVVSVGWGLNLDLLSAIVGTVTSIRMISSNS
ncbi:MAG: hypothetical protein HYU48_00290 [Candidatus Levybacteria bacterium]|nr:hypothetical protein [Candidatus Levybacteria bacterium]